MRVPVVAVALALTSLCVAQVPDVQIKLDLSLAYRIDSLGQGRVRWYDYAGRYSTVGLRFTLEPGFKAVVTERLGKIPGNSDAEQLDEYFIEDPGLWRLGKQYIPFGRGLVRESVIAARGETNLFLEGIPVVAALCDGGTGRPRGVSGRIGGRVGLSVLVGEYFGASSTSFSPFHVPETSPGSRRGYGFAIGCDGSKRLGSWTIAGEAVALRRGKPGDEIGRAHV